MFQSAVQIHEISCIEDIIYTYISRIYGLLMDPHNDLLQVGPTAQLEEHVTRIAEVRVKVPFRPFFKDGAYYCYCAYVLRISRYSDFLLPMLTNTGIFLRGLKLSGESRS